VTDSIGNQLPQPDPRGWLTFDALPDALQRAEDSTAAADFDRRRFSRTIQRPATDTERLLLEHLGYEVPTPLTTHVRYLTESVRNRSWPALEESQEES
jgi:hypothetical protein